ncbi:UDP-glucosyl transferase 76E1 [Striga asiatica]|uniref:UDP-glucosyl transferase 76E1 n=1 Tax=Striga asiatica TaxID=4170 RepID=A0A5A7QN02_STRAF|nr:UDP-glucosyl transferase 76E1 [Striga asiatica]
MLPSIAALQHHPEHSLRVCHQSKVASQHNHPAAGCSQAQCSDMRSLAASKSLSVSILLAAAGNLKEDLFHSLEYLHIKIQHAHLKRQAPASQRRRRCRSTDNSQHQPTAPPHPAAERLHRSEPPGGRKGVPREQVRAPEQPQNERHHRVRHLLGPAHVHVDHPAQPEFGREGRVHCPVGGSEAEYQLPGAEPALSGAREEGERVDEDRRRRLDPRLGQPTQRHVLHTRHAGEALLLERRVLDAVKRDNDRKRINENFCDFRIIVLKGKETRKKLSNTSIRLLLKLESKIFICNGKHTLLIGSHSFVVASSTGAGVPSA